MSKAIFVTNLQACLSMAGQLHFTAMDDCEPFETLNGKQTRKEIVDNLKACDFVQVTVETVTGLTATFLVDWYTKEEGEWLVDYTANPFAELFRSPAFAPMER